MSKQFKDITEAKEYLEKLQTKVAEYNDLQYNLGQEMEKEKTTPDLKEERDK